MELSSLLQIDRGVTAIIGGGGKTTLMYTLAEELRNKGTVILCTSTHIRIPETYPLLSGEDPAALAEAARRGAVCAGLPCGDGKLTAPAVSFSRLAGLADHVLVEADGSRGLPMKAHEAHEPVIPENAGRTVLVLGADGFGRPIREACHRPELYASLAGADPDDIVTPSLAARVLADEGYGDILFINKMEDDQRRRDARSLASLMPCPVFGGSLREGVWECLC